MVAISKEKKAAVVAACCKWSDPRTGRIVRNGMKYVRRQFPEIGERSIRRFHGQYKANPAWLDLGHRRSGRCGNKAKLVPVVRAEYVRITQEYANMWIRLTVRKLQKELDDAGHHFAKSTISEHLKLLNAKKKPFYQASLDPRT
jgi:hypothetical protein